MKSSDLCVVAPPRRILAEYRAVVIDRKAVSVCRYKLGGHKNLEAAAPEGVWAFAKEAAAEIDLPERAYMLDIACEEGGRLSVIEVNAFSCSDLYASEFEGVVNSLEHEPTVN